MEQRYGAWNVLMPICQMSNVKSHPKKPDFPALTLDQFEWTEALPLHCVLAILMSGLPKHRWFTSHGKYLAMSTGATLFPSLFLFAPQGSVLLHLTLLAAAPRCFYSMYFMIIHGSSILFQVWSWCVAFLIFLKSLRNSDRKIEIVMFSCSRLKCNMCGGSPHGANHDMKVMTQNDTHLHHSPTQVRTGLRFSI